MEGLDILTLILVINTYLVFLNSCTVYPGINSLSKQVVDNLRDRDPGVSIGGVSLRHCQVLAD